MSRDSRDLPTAEEQEEAIAEFLSRTGAVGLLREATPFHNEGLQFSEFNEKLSVSSSTLSKRLNEACELNLLTINLESTDYGSNNLYVLTQTGRTLRGQMQQFGIFRTYDKIQTLEEEFDESVDDLREWVRGELLTRESRSFDPR